MSRIKNSWTEQCSICLEDMTDQQIGMPEHCEHEFCFNCLANWAETNNTCPQDRKNFEFILKKQSFFRAKPYAKVNINNTKLEILLKEEVILCQICDTADDEYQPLLTCTQCKNNFHEFCLNSFDITSWICPSCGHNHEEPKEEVWLPVDELSKVRKARIQTSSQKPVKRLENTMTKHIPSLQAPKDNRPFMTPAEAARRIAASGKPVVPCPRSAALASQTQYMAALHRKRKQVARLPPKIPVNQFSRIQRRTDAPIRPHLKIITQKSNNSSNVPFLHKLLQSQKQLHSLEKIQIKGANIKLS